MRFCTVGARRWCFREEEEEFGGPVVGFWGGSPAVQGSGLGARQRFPTAGTARPFLIAGGEVPRRWLRSRTPGPHLLLFEVRKRLLIDRQKTGTWDLGLLASAGG